MNKENMNIIKGDANLYLSEFMGDLPDNCYFNKALTGCGATSIAIENNIPYVITVPYISLILAKCKIHPNLCGVFGDIRDDYIEEYLKKGFDIPKFMVTYDSLPRLMSFINPSNYKLMIDEAHKLLDSASFRHNAVENVLENFKRFKSYCFVTATPVKSKYQLPELKELPQYEVKWTNTIPVDVVHTKIEKDLKSVIAAKIIEYLKEEKEGCAFFFVNSVTLIINILRLLIKAGYENPNYYRIIISDNEKNEARINQELGELYHIEYAFSPQKPITFITSTAFEGVDFYCENSTTYIITDGFRDHTKYDILTTIPQIIGRIRNSKNKNKINVLYTENQYFQYESIDEYEEYVKNNIEESKEIVNLFHFAKNNRSKDIILMGSSTDPYVVERKGNLKANTSVKLCELHHYETINSKFYIKDFDTRVVNSTQFNYIKSNEKVKVDALDKLRMKKKPSFKELCLRYIELQDRELKLKKDCEQIREIENYKPIIKEAYEILSSNKMKALDYRENNFNKALIVARDLTNVHKIQNLLKYKIGQKIAKSKIKQDLQDAYKVLNIKKVAFATDIQNFYKVKNTTIKVDNSLVNCFSILEPIIR